MGMDAGSGANAPVIKSKTLSTLYTSIQEGLQRPGPCLDVLANRSTSSARINIGLATKSTWQTIKEMALGEVCGDRQWLDWSKQPQVLGIPPVHFCNGRGKVARGYIQGMNAFSR